METWYKVITPRKKSKKDDVVLKNFGSNFGVCSAPYTLLNRLRNPANIKLAVKQMQHFGIWYKVQH